MFAKYGSAEKRNRNEIIPYVSISETRMSWDSEMAPVDDQIVNEELIYRYGGTLPSSIESSLPTNDSLLMSFQRSRENSRF